MFKMMKEFVYIPICILGMFLSYRYPSLNSFLAFLYYFISSNRYYWNKDREYISLFGSKLRKYGFLNGLTLHKDEAPAAFKFVQTFLFYSSYLALFYGIANLVYKNI